MGAMQAQKPAPVRMDRLSTLFAFMLGHFSHHVCTAVAIPLLPMIRDAFALDYLRAGLLLSAFSLAYGFAQLPMAVISDRFSKRIIVSLGLLGTGVASVGAGISADYLQILLSLVLMGLAGSTYHAPASAFLSQVFSKEDRGRSLGFHIVGGTSGLMAAPFLAILVANLAGSWRYSFIAMGVPALIAGLLVLIVARAQEMANIRAMARELVEPLDVMKLLRALGLLVMIALLTQVLVSGLNSFLPLYLVDKHGMSPDLAGLMMGIVYGAGVLGAPVAGALSDRVGRKPVILLSVVTVGPLMFLVTVLPLGLAMTGVIAFYGLFLVFRLPAIESLVADVVPARRRATVLGAYYFISQESAGVATPVLGWMMDQHGINNAFVALSIVGVGCALLALLLWRKV